MKKIIFFFSILIALGINGISVAAAEKTISADVPKDYTAAKFIVSFDEEDDYTVVIKNPNGTDTYEATKTDTREYTCIIQNVKSGKWTVDISTPEQETSEDTDAAESPEVEQSESVAKEIGAVHIKIEGSSKELAEVSSEIVVAEDINGLNMYFKDNVFIAEWDDYSKGTLQIEITDSKSQEKLASETASNGHFECEIDAEKHENITVKLVPTQSSSVKGAERLWTFSTYNEPDVTLTFEDAVITNKDTTPLKATLGKDYKITAYLNDKIIYDESLTAGENDIDLKTEVGNNSYLVYVTDPDNGYIKSYTYSIEKDVVAPVLKFASSYENITTEAESITFEGEIEPDYVSFTINDADISVEGDHTFKYTYELKEGINNISIIASDAAGNVTEYDTTITRIIPEVAKVPWAPIIISVSLVGLLITYIVSMVIRRRRGEKNISQPQKKKTSVKKNIQKDDKNRKKSSNKDIIPEWSQFILRVTIPVIGAFIILTKIICVTSVASGSMEPKLMTGNTAVYNRLAYLNSEPQRGDIISFYSSEFGEVFAKRVIGIPGDNIEFINGYVYINGMQADESDYIDGNIETNSAKKFTVPENCVFVLGDNREDSYDSRFWEMPYISYDSIYGKYIGELPFHLPNIFDLG